jgi:hypothetical protein
LMSSNPGQIAELVHTELPLERTRALKRTKQFMDMVHDLEDKLTGLQNKAEEK